MTTWKRGQRAAKSQRDRLKAQEAEAEQRLYAGEYKAALNIGLQAVQSELAKMFRERPEDGAVLYSFYCRKMFEVAESVQQHVMPSDRDLHRVSLMSAMVPRPRPMTPRGDR